MRAQGTTRGSASARNVSLQVTSGPGWTGTPVGIFTPADAEGFRRLFEAHGVEIWAETQVSAAQERAGAGASVGSVTPQVAPATGSS
jgi:hypothetical protein